MPIEPEELFLKLSDINKEGITLSIEKIFSEVIENYVRENSSNSFTKDGNCLCETVNTRTVSK